MKSMWIGINIGGLGSLYNYRSEKRALAWCLSLQPCRAVSHRIGLEGKRLGNEIVEYLHSQSLKDEELKP